MKNDVNIKLKEQVLSLYKAAANVAMAQNALRDIGQYYFPSENFGQFYFSGRIQR